MELPEDLSSLKRPALQKLCKNAGLKANGKNVDMVKALEELRAATTEGSENVAVSDNKVEPPEEVQLPSPPPPSPPRADPGLPSETPPPSAMDPPSHEPKKKLQQPRKKTQRKGKSRKGRSNTKKRSNDSSQNSTPNISTSESPAPNIINPPEDEKMDTSTSSAPNSKANPISPNTSTEVKQDITTPEDAREETPPLSDSRKRKRRDTYSVSPQPRKQTKLDTHQQLEAEEALLSMESAFAEGPPPFSPPSSSDRPSSRKRKRCSTYTKPGPTVISSADSTTVETPSSSFSDKPQLTPEVLTIGMEEGLHSCGEMTTTPPLPDEEDSHPPETKRQRRSTFEISPAAALPSSEIASEEEGQLSVESEILRLLEQRVEERKADPSYKPAVAPSTAVSRIPVKSATASRLDRAHQKEFSKMRSIVDHQKRKEHNKAANSRASALHTRPTLSSSTKKTVSTVTKVPPSKKGPTIVKPVLPRRPLNPAAPKTTTTTPFKPTVLKAKNANFNFGSQHKATALKKAPGSTATGGLKTPLKQLTTHIASKSSTKFKPYTGKVPPFKI